MIFIVALNEGCVRDVAEREGLSASEVIGWTRNNSAWRKMCGLSEPTVWITECGQSVLSEIDRDRIATRRPRLARVLC